ncbi:hypothetical protein FACS1894113_3300 [Alphaproteobacteria bacterium]|nr:hypothetical protein FACS1894113_3300 [Alphaproteobacteria bacterium]
MIKLRKIILSAMCCCSLASNAMCDEHYQVLPTDRLPVNAANFPDIWVFANAVCDFVKGFERGSFGFPLGFDVTVDERLLISLMACFSDAMGQRHFGISGGVGFGRSVC